MRTTPWSRVTTLATLCALGTLTTGAAGRQPTPAIEGAWAAQAYRLADGTVHRVEGRIFFTKTQWTVLFFVMDGDRARRGSAEGGVYTLAGDQLVFTHHYNLSAGDAMPGLDASPLRMTVRTADDAPTEPCRVTVEGTSMTIDFPSGNSMTFTRAPV